MAISSGGWPVALRVRQVQVAGDQQQALRLARSVVAGKLHNQGVLLRRYSEALGQRGQAALQVIGEQIANAQRADRLDALRGYEGSGAAAYFAAWPALFDAER